MPTGKTVLRHNHVSQMLWEAKFGMSTKIELQWEQDAAKFSHKKKSIFGEVSLYL